MQRVSYPDAIRGAGIILVVAIHAIAYLKVPPNSLWLPLGVAVPIFFLADGWLYANRSRGPATLAAGAAYLAASARRLMLPWLLFSALYLATRLAAERWGSAGGIPALPHGWTGIPSAIWHCHADRAMYFLPALMLVRIASVILHPLVRGRPWIAAAAPAVLMIAWRLGVRPFVSFPPGGEEPLLAAAMGIGFAAVGWAFAEAEISGVRQWVPAAAVASAALICGLLSVPGASREVIQAAELLAFWLAARNLGGWMPHRWLAWLGRRTMEIYLLHGPWVLHLVTAALLIVRRPCLSRSRWRPPWPEHLPSPPCCAGSGWPGRGEGGHHGGWRPPGEYWRLRASGCHPE